MTAAQAKKRHVAVLMGGWSAEREVSLVSGKAVCQSLEELGHRVTIIDVQRDLEAVVKAIAPANDRPEIVFNALHGRGGEDGVMQGLLEFVGIPYTHSGVAASAVAMDKPLAKTTVSKFGVRCADGTIVSRDDLMKNGYPFPPPSPAFRHQAAQRRFERRCAHRA